MMSRHSRGGMRPDWAETAKVRQMIRAAPILQLHIVVVIYSGMDLRIKRDDEKGICDSVERRFGMMKRGCVR